MTATSWQHPKSTRAHGTLHRLFDLDVPTDIMSILSIRPQDGGWPLSGNDFHFPLTYFHIPCPAPITAGHEENGGWQQIDKRPTSSPVGF